MASGNPVPRRPDTDATAAAPAGHEARETQSSGGKQHAHGRNPGHTPPLDPTAALAHPPNEPAPGPQPQPPAGHGARETPSSGGKQHAHGRNPGHRPPLDPTAALARPTNQPRATAAAPAGHGAWILERGGAVVSGAARRTQGVRAPFPAMRAGPSRGQSALSTGSERPFPRCAQDPDGARAPSARCRARPRRAGHARSGRWRDQARGRERDRWRQSQWWRSPRPGAPTPGPDRG